MSIIIVGDPSNGIQPRVKEIEKQMESGDSVIFCGDTGLLFLNNYEENEFLDFLETRPFYYLFVDGNHENFPAINSYPEQIWNGGRIHRIRKNIIHLMRGQVFEIEGLKFFTFGGGYSLDKEKRLVYERNNGPKIWWEEEMPTQEEYDEGKRNLEKHDWTVDYIITHTLNIESIPVLAGMERYIGIKSSCIEEFPLNYYLEDIRKFAHYKEWFFGHFHKDRRIKHTRQTGLFLDVVKLN